MHKTNCQRVDNTCARINLTKNPRYPRVVRRLCVNSTACDGTTNPERLVSYAIDNEQTMVYGLWLEGLRLLQVGTGCLTYGLGELEELGIGHTCSCATP